MWICHNRKIIWFITIILSLMKLFCFSGEPAKGTDDSYSHGNDSVPTSQCQLSSCHDTHRDDIIQCSGCHLGVRILSAVQKCIFRYNCMHKCYVQKYYFVLLFYII